MRNTVVARAPWEESVNIGRPKRIIEVEPASLPLPEPLTEPLAPTPEPVPTTPDTTPVEPAAP
jgi:hypothetical protein